MAEDCGAKNFTTLPPQTTTFLLLYPSPYVLLVTIDRAQAMNSIPIAGHWEAHDLFQWFDNEPNLRVAIITGSGTKAFCAGQDLIEQNKKRAESTNVSRSSHPPGGFAALSRRLGKKPVIAAINGFALGGGFEICLNCDLVVASPKASFGLPESTVGLYAGAGGLARVVRNCGLQIGSEIGLTGRRLSAQEAKGFHLVNVIAQTPESVVEEALKLARHIADISPDATFVTRQGLREAWETASVERATQLTGDRWAEKLMRGENARIGLAAFAAKKKPQWVSSNL
ncbi:enoyl-CoA hydratase-like protein [Eremomyces bilateralis CBS 781.70]|uniref:Enoyl-CoA hydratase-like protein n=1 Tax=Eremomyces bilateralis CBS 781.70 TaxID=1392243 RepID=A0A6G1G454_9PEZI|nr:enoyl-CoA hydratase-like protein [Eremomyces bilateralis CBS 781.70]KAF1812762.1 enoyl-CoA hydratase-like protein [Eremomyces bilateralis CBS 781.70]